MSLSQEFPDGFDSGQLIHLWQETTARTHAKRIGRRFYGFVGRGLARNQREASHLPVSRLNLEDPSPNNLKTIG